MFHGDELNSGIITCLKMLTHGRTEYHGPDNSDKAKKLILIDSRQFSVILDDSRISLKSILSDSQ